MTTSHSLLFADGASSGNPGPSGWAYLLKTESGEIHENGGHEPKATNNRMELLAAVEGLTHADQLGLKTLTLYLDSQYVIKGATQWISGWAKNGWKTKEGTPVQHSDLWEKIFLYSKKLKLTWNYVAAHQGVEGNERVDQLAVSFSKNQKPTLYQGKFQNYSINLEAKKNFKPFYLSLVDQKLFRHAEWKSCEAAVKGKKKPRYKKITSSLELKETLKSWGVPDKIPDEDQS